LLFLFCMLVQFCIGVQWLSSTGASPCDYETREHVLSLLYVVFLMAFSSALALKARRYRDNYREARYIGAALLVTAPAWCAWVVAAAVTDVRDQPACVGK